METPLRLGSKRDVTFDSGTPYITPTLSQANQRRQVDALIYMFKKLPKPRTVEAFHLHRYQDMPDREGDLRFGFLDEDGRLKPRLIS